MATQDYYSKAEQYQKKSDFYPTRGADENLLNGGNNEAYGSLANKLHIIKLRTAEGYVDADDATFYKKVVRAPKSFYDLCTMDFSNAVQYDPDDFLYCKNLGFPITRLITLRRFPYPCVDNIFDKSVQPQPDIARMVTFFDQTNNKLEDLLQYSYRMKWKELTATMEQANMQGDQSGFTGYMKKIGKWFDGELSANVMQGGADSNALNYDPIHDQNKTYGPVDSLITTHIRDVGLEFEKEFEIVFEYNLRSINGRTPELAMKDIMANVLAVTFNDGKFWGGSRFWVGERPSKFFQNFSYLNSRDLDTLMFGAYNHLKSALDSFKNPTQGSAVDALKNVMTNGLRIAIGKILDSVGRPSIVVMNSLLNNEATGYWHLMIGDPSNPILCVGNLICTDTEVTFPTDSLSYAGFPTKIQFKVKLKPAQSKDRAGIEMMFNTGRERMYYAPKQVTVNKTKTNTKTTNRNFFGFSEKEIDSALGEAYSFLKDGVDVVIRETTGGSTFSTPKATPEQNQEQTTSNSNRNMLASNTEV